MALIGAKPVPLASSTIGLSLSSRRKKLPKGPSMRRMSRSFMRAEDMVGELAAGHVAHVQFDRRRAAQVVRRIGHAVAAPGAVAQDELDVLSGAVLQVLVGRQLQAQHGHVGGGPVDAQHAAGQLEHRVFAGAGHAARFDDAVGLRRGAAGEDEAGLLLGHRQRLVLVRAVDHAAFEQPALARAAGAVAAAVGQADALADGGRQDGARRARRRSARLAGCRVMVKLMAGGADGLVNSASDCAPAPDTPMPTSLPLIPCPPAHAADRRLRRRRPARAAAAAPALARAGADLVAGARAGVARAGRGAAAGRSRRAGHAGPPGRPGRCRAAPGAAAGHGADDPRTRALLRALARGGRVRRLVYASTSGVYGDCGGARFDETRAVDAGTDRARRRVDAEAQLRWFGRRSGVRVTRAAHPRHLRRRPPRRPPARAPGARHAGAGGRRRRLHQPHPCRRPGARLRGGAVPRRAAARAARQRRQRAEDGRLFRPRRRPLRPAAAAAHHARRSGDCS